MNLGKRSVERNVPQGDLPVAHGEPPPEIRVILADDHGLVRAGTKALLATMPGINVIAEASNGAELVALAEALRPHMVVTDLSMPVMDGLTAISWLHEMTPEIRVVVLSMHDSPDDIRRAVANGASGFLSKVAAPDELERAILAIMSSGTYFGPSVAARLLQPREPTIDDQLTRRQVEILTLLAHGHGAKEIGYELGLSSKTVDVHRSRIMLRLRLNDIASLTRYAIRMGLVTP